MVERIKSTLTIPNVNKYMTVLVCGMLPIGQEYVSLEIGNILKLIVNLESSPRGSVRILQPAVSKLGSIKNLALL